MTSFLRRFDALTSRWELRRDDRIPTGDIVDLEDGLSLTFDSEGRPAEALVADEVIESLSAASKELLSEHFESAWTEIGTRAARPPALADGAPTALPGEPGRPIEIEPGVWEVPSPLGAIRLVVDDEGIRITVPRHVPRDDIWVRISESENGTLLALGRLRNGEESSTAVVSFGIDLAPDRLHVHVSDDPLIDVGDGNTRRSRWLSDLLQRANQLRRRRPRTSARLAAEAERVARLIGDDEGADRARRIGNRARRWKWVTLLGPLAVVVGVVVLVVAVTKSDDRSTVVAPTSTSTSTSAPPPPRRLADGFRGGSNVSFSSGESATVSVAIDDGILTVTIEDVVIRPFGFGKDPTQDGELPSEESARSNCTNAQALPASPTLETSVPPTDYQIGLVDASGERPDIAVGEVIVDAPFELFSSIIEECATAPFLPDGQLSVDTRLFRAAQSFEFDETEFADELAGATEWTIVISRQVPGQTLDVGTFDQPIVFPTVIRDSGAGSSPQG